jgi:uncharacterized membrane protein YccC
MANIRASQRRVALAVFRIHIENGLSVALGVGLTGLGVGVLFGFTGAVAAAMGAVAASLSDQPDPLSQKPWILGFAFALTVIFTALPSFAVFNSWAFFAATIFTGLFTGLISAYGKRALTLSMTGVLAFVFAMGQHFGTPAEAAAHLALTTLGAFLFTIYAGLLAWVFDDRVRRLLLAEAMRSFAAYLRAKAALYSPDAQGSGPFKVLINSYAALVDRLQAARDAVYARRTHPIQLKRIDSLIALLDAFEAMLAGDADLDLLRRSQRRDIKWRIHALILHIADQVDGLTLVLRGRHARVTPRGHEEEDDALVTAVADANQHAPEDPASDHAFAVTVAKLRLADTYVKALAATLDSATPASALASELDLTAFRAPVPRGLEILKRQFDWNAPALRYAIRLSLAMSLGLGVTMIFPQFAHANWVLLTIALIMRANYSVTTQRRWDRITGTLIGCTLAVGLIFLLPDPLLLLSILIAVGVSHAYVAVRYRITAIAASVSSLLLLHFSAGTGHPQFYERIIDTLIGGAVSWAFGYVLPTWEQDDLPRIVRSLLAADVGFATVTLRLSSTQQEYRLARKKAMDAVAQLSGAIRRLADEPDIRRRALASLTELLAANYLFFSSLASMPILVKLRGTDLDASAGARIDAARGRVIALLAHKPAPLGETFSSPSQPTMAMAILARRLAHIERSAGKVLRLAARLE